MMIFGVLVTCLIIAYVQVQVQSEVLEDPIVETKYGHVKGSVKTSRDNRTFFSFTGIPYAKPPVGDLRFKTPQVPEPWTGIYDAQKESPHCIQKNYLFANPVVEGQEDCLYLNVYSPKLRSKRNIETEVLLPVMVFIHWGGFFTGYATSDYLGPEYFMDQNVILVTFNYRLGVMGFLSTNDDVAPGNYGLKDQVAVLKWVQENIKNFGGNKDSVTLFGQSAGGASVHYHMLSPLSRNLFHRGISQSGTGLALWGKPIGALQNQLTRVQSRISGCDATATNAEIIKCLRQVNAVDLVESGQNFKIFSIDPVTVYLPSIETATKDNPDPFFTKSVEEYIKNKEFMDVPWIVGVVEQEGLIRAEPLIRQASTRSSLNDRFDTLMPNLLMLKLSVPEKNITSFWESLKSFYMKGKSRISVDDTSSIEGLINIYTDRSFFYSSRQSVLLQKYYNHSSIWFYKFNYRGHVSYGDKFAATDETVDYPWGVSHCDDLIYLFKSPALFPDELTNKEKALSECLIQTWANFATLGDPNSDCIRWRKTNNFEMSSSRDIKYLSIEGNHETDFKTTMKLSPHQDRVKFWETQPVYENFKELNQTVVEV